MLLKVHNTFSQMPFLRSKFTTGLAHNDQYYLHKYIIIFILPSLMTHIPKHVQNSQRDQNEQSYSLT